MNSALSITRFAQKSGVPTKRNVKLKYGALINKNDALAAVVHQIFRANSLFDPDFTGIGHQPMGFDQWSALYSRYRVNAAKIEVTWVQSNTTEDAHFFAGIELAGTTTPRSDPEQIIESSQSVYAGLGNTSAGSATKTITMYVDLKKAFGVKDLSDHNYSATTGNNPTNQLYFQCSTFALSGASILEFFMITEITYYVTFFDPRELGAS